MARFVYQARDASGRMDCGAIAADSAEEATRMLRKDGKAVLSVKEEQTELTAYSRAQARKSKIKRDEVIFFTTQLAVMVDTGVPLSEALDSISAHITHPGMKVIVEDISEDIKGGVEFSAALQKYPRLFNDLYVALMQASEASGSMGLMLERLSSYMADERDIRKTVKGAMVYPICMLAFCTIVVVGLMVFILPRFEKIYANKGAALPVPTRILMAISHTLLGYWPLFVIGVAGTVVGAYYYFRSPTGREVLDKIKISVPGIGGMYRKACLARILRTMATMVSSGVSMLDAIQITACAAGNDLYKRLWEGLGDGVKEGANLSDQLFLCPLIPATVSQMISAGEKTGRLGPVMDRVAKFCEDDLRVAVKSMTSLIEPVMIIAMGLLVGGIAMALLLPVFSLSKVVSR